MSRLLDTDVCILLVTGRDPSVRARLEEHLPGEVALCSVVKAELLYGARASARVEHNLAVLDDFLEPFFSFAFDDAAAALYGELRAALRRAGTPIGGNDLMIAAIALAHDLTLVSRNVREFERVPELALEAW